MCKADVQDECFLVLDLCLDIVLKCASLSWIFALTSSQVCFLDLDLGLDIELRKHPSNTLY